MSVIATRRERVLLELEDHFSREMGKPIAATKALDAVLNDLSGSAVRTARHQEAVTRSTKALGDETDSTSRSLRDGARDIDRYSGRLALLAQAAAVLGPALVPIGAAAIPAITGLAGQMGALAGSVGVAILAFSGMGDALEALNDYQLEPTAENFLAMRLELEKLGPDGAHFVKFLDSLEPQLRSLQMSARAGLLPGVEEGIASLLDRMPQVRRIVSEMAAVMGELAGDAGDALAGPKFDDFFRYLDREAGPILEGLGRTLGNFAAGLAQMLVEFAPVSRGFTTGLEEMSESFLNWTQGLDQNQSFQEFLDYIRQSGPQVLDLLGSMVSAFASIAKAAAPVGDIVVPALTGMLNAISELASSPLGTLFFTAAAGLSVYSRAAAVAARAQAALGRSAILTDLRAMPGALLSVASAQDRARMSADDFAAAETRKAASIKAGLRAAGQSAATLGVLAAVTSGATDKMGLTNAAMLGLTGTMIGPWGAAAGTAVGLTMDFAAANNDLESAVRAANAAIEAGSRRELRAAQDALEEMLSKAEDARDFDWSLNPVKHMREGWSWVFQTYNDLSGESRKVQGSLDQVNGALSRSGGIAEIFGSAIGMTGRQMRVAAGDARALSGALAELEGWLDRRAALRNYEQSLDDLTAGLKENAGAWDRGTQKGRENLELLDAFATSAVQVASKIKDDGNRNTFLAGARKDLLNLVQQFPASEKAIQKLLNKLNTVGLTRPKPKVDPDTKGADRKLDNVMSGLDAVDRKRPKPKIDADERPARRKANAVDRWLSELTGKTAEPTIDANNAPAMAKIDAVRAARIADKSFTISANVVGAALGKMEWDSGGYTGHGRRLDAAGIVHRGEVVLPQDVVKRDKSHLMSRYGFLPNMRALGDLPGYADGGAVGIKPQGTLDDRLAIAQALQQIRDLRRDLNARVKKGKNKGDLVTSGIDRKLMELQLKAAQKELSAAQNREKRELEAARREQLMDRYRAALGKELDRETAARGRLSEAVDRNQSEVDRLTGLYDNLAGTIRSGLEVDTFGRVPNTGNAWNNGGKDRLPTFDEALDRLNKGTGGAYDFIRGTTTLSSALSGAALESVLSQGLDVVNMMAAQGPERLREYQAAFDKNAVAKGFAGEMGGHGVYGRDLAKSEALLSSSLAEETRQTAAVEALQRTMDNASTESARARREANEYFEQMVDAISDLGGRTKSGHRSKRGG